METIEQMHDTVSYDGINLSKDDFMELKKVFREKLNQGPQILSLNINKNEKLITLRGKEFKEAGKTITEIFVKLKHANFPLVFQDKIKMITQDSYIQRYELNSNQGEYKYVKDLLL
jgi:aspartokinase